TCDGQNLDRGFGFYFTEANLEIPELLAHERCPIVENLETFIGGCACSNGNQLFQRNSRSLDNGGRRVIIRILRRWYPFEHIDQAKCIKYTKDAPQVGFGKRRRRRECREGSWAQDTFQDKKLLRIPGQLGQIFALTKNQERP